MGIESDISRFMGGTIDSNFDMVCLKCKRKAIGRLICEAFPRGIPDEIKSGENDHTQPFPGDNGILFEPKENV